MENLDKKNITGEDGNLFRDFFEFAKFPMLLIEEDTTIALCNRAFEALSGYRSDEVQGKMSWSRIVAEPEELEKMMEYHHLRRTAAVSVPEEYEFQMVNSRGERKYIALSIAMLPGIKRSLAFLQDITEKKQTETWYKAVFENTGLPSIIIAPDTTIIKANTEWALLSGDSIEEIEGKKSWTSYVDKEDLERMRNYHKTRRADSDGAPRKYEFRFIRRNGEVRYIANSVTMIPGSTYSIASLMDITDIREAMAETRKLDEELQQARKLESIGHLAGGVAHDFNNMLAAILGNAQIVQIKFNKEKELLSRNIGNLHDNMEEPLKMLLELIDSDQGMKNLVSGLLVNVRESVKMLEAEVHYNHEKNELVSEIIKAAQRAANLTRQLLAFARKQTLDVKPMNLNKVIIDFEKMLRRTIRENVDIELNLFQDLDPVEADIGQVEQIILNLALNSQDAMPGGGKIIIRTENRFLDEEYVETHGGVASGYYVMLEISDTGMGIDKENQKKIFEPFFTTKDPGKGTGLGLATVYGIVKQHSGNIWFYSEPGKGTAFHIYFPVCRKRPEEILKDETETTVCGKETVLIVEDQPEVRRVTSIMLQQKGYNILEVSNGYEAIEKAQKFDGKIDLLVSDVVMPGMNGKDVYVELLKLRPDLKALFMSGYPREIISHHGILDEGFNFLSKPVSVDEFTKKVREILDKK